MSRGKPRTLKYEVETLDGLDDATQKLYTEKDRKYRLAIEGIPDTDKTKNNTGLLEKAKQEAQEKAAALKKQLDELKSAAVKNKEKTAKKKDNIDALEKSWQDKLSKREQEQQTQIDNLNSSLQNTLIDKEAARIASELAVEGSADVLLPHIKARLGVDVRDGQHVTVVNGTDGKPSALTLDELTKEISEIAAFAL